MSDNAARPASHSGWRGRLGMAALGLILVAGVVAYSTLQFGNVRGEEFSPRRFKRREFWYAELPLVGLQVMPIRRTDSTGALEDYLIQENIVQLDAQAPDRWDLVVAQRNQTILARGDAQILCRYLDAETDSGANVWLEWSKQHPGAARAVWPHVARLADQELYVYIPEILELARGAESGDEAARRVKATLAMRYSELALVQQQLGRHDQAIELFDEALVCDPQLPGVRESRAVSRAALGESTEAAGRRTRHGAP